MLNSVDLEILFDTDMKMEKKSKKNKKKSKKKISSSNQGISQPTIGYISISG